MILVTGGTGMVGSNLLLELSKSKVEIIATKRENSNLAIVRDIFKKNNLQLEYEKIKWVNADLTDYFSLENIFKTFDVTYVYHCAAQISYRKQDDDMLLENNVESTTNIVNLSLINNLTKLCYVSSIAALGVSENGGLITEDTDFDTEGKSSGYSTSKYKAELEVWRGIAEGLNAVIVNPSVILGAGDWKSGSSSIFSTIYSGLKFYTKGITGFVDVRDVVKVMILLVNSQLNSERFIINSENIGYYEFFKMVAYNLNVKAPSIYANVKLTSLAWRLEYIKSVMLKKQPVITSNSARTSHKELLYSNDKLNNCISYDFIKVEDSIKYYSKMFLEDNKK
jgi:nucleoside-diphosphate-sugar epimerase